MTFSYIPTSMSLPYLRQYLDEAKVTDDTVCNESVSNDASVRSDIDGAAGDEGFTYSAGDGIPESVIEGSGAGEGGVAEGVIEESGAGNACAPDDAVSVVDALLTASDVFNVKNEYPIHANRCKHLVGKEKVTKGDLSRDIKACYPILHEDVITLICAFMIVKKNHGSEKEKEFYRDMSLTTFVDRLIAKRPLKFVGDLDSYILRDTRRTGSMNWESIGTDSESPPLLLADYMSYDEVKLASFLCASSPVYPINSGKRHSAGVVDFQEEPYVRRAIYVGVVGARMVKSGAMEAQEVIVEPEQNQVQYGYGFGNNVTFSGYDNEDKVEEEEYEQRSSAVTADLSTATTDATTPIASPPKRAFATLALMYKFYGLPSTLPTFAEMLAASKVATSPVFEDAKLPVSAKTKALRKLSKPWKTLKRRFLFPSIHEDLVKMIEDGRVVCRKNPKDPDADQMFFNIDVYKKRTRITAETYLMEANERAKVEGKQAYVHVVGFGLGVWQVLGNQHQLFLSVFEDVLQSVALPHVSDLDFSWIPSKKLGVTESGQIYPNTNIKIHFSMRDPFQPLPDDDSSEKLIVASWAWDANSFPGNEYWNRCLTSSSDPAAACCSQIQETLNPFVNAHYNAKNLRVACRVGGLRTLKEYAQLTLGVSDLKEMAQKMTDELSERS